MRETDESRADVRNTATDLVTIAQCLGDVLDVAMRGHMTRDADAVRGLASSAREAVDRAEAQLLARIPSAQVPR
jgi:hypothetical protein